MDEQDQARVFVGWTITFGPYGECTPRYVTYDTEQEKA